MPLRAAGLHDMPSLNDGPTPETSIQHLPLGLAARISTLSGCLSSLPHSSLTSRRAHPVCRLPESAEFRPHSITERAGCRCFTLRRIQLEARQPPEESSRRFPRPSSIVFQVYAAQLTAAGVEHVRRISSSLPGAAPFPFSFLPQ